MSGQNFLLLKNQDFLYKLQVIKMDLEKKSHPISEVIELFVKLLIGENRLLLYGMYFNNDDFHRIPSYSNMEYEVKRCVKEVLCFRDVVQDAIVRFYNLEFRGYNDLNIELLQNMVTCFLVKEELYIFI